jgi:hypothetical protein
MDSNHCAGCHEPLDAREAHKLRLLLSPPGFNLEDRALFHAVAETHLDPSCIQKAIERAMGQVDRFLEPVVV